MASSKKTIGHSDITRTDNYRDFLSAAREFEVATFARPEDTKPPLREIFTDKINNQFKAGILLRGYIDENGNTAFEDLPETLEGAREELEGMGRTYYALSGHDTFTIEISNLAGLSQHTHPHDTLNCVWGDRATIFPSEHGNFLTKEGDWTFFKKNVVHEASFQLNQGRTTVVVYPRSKDNPQHTMGAQEIDIK